MSTARSRWLVLGGVAVVGLLGTVAVLGRLPGREPTPDGSAAGPAPKDAVAVTVAPVTPRPIGRTVHVVGTFFGYEETTISPKVEGRIVKIHHDVGDAVKPGDVLLEIDDTDFTLALEEAQKGLELELARLGLKALPDQAFDVDAVPTVARARFQQENAQSKLSRAAALGSGRAISREDLDQARTEAQVARASYDQAVLEARATLAAARQKSAQVATARQRLADTKVVAPAPSAERLGSVPAAAKVTADRVEYLVAGRMASEGEMIRIFGGTSTVFRLVMDRPLKLQATIPERHVGQVQVGQPVDLAVEAYPREVFHGQVSRVNPTVDRASRTFQVEVHVGNADRKLKPGSFVKGAIRTHVDPAAPTVPEEALVRFAGVTKVFAVRDGRAVEVPVRPGERLAVAGPRRPASWVEVGGDLPAGAVVVTSGHSQLAAGTPVRVRDPQKHGK